jgi:4a-hydroxytetrahydrobiopterin dehydratase
MGLADKACIPCRGGVPPVEPSRAQELLTELARGWQINKDGHLERLYTFSDFARALDFVNKVGAVAEAEGHHKSNGLTESDFYLAAKADRAFDSMPSAA